MVTKVDSTESLQTETSYLNESTQVDTTMTVRVEQINDSKVITETIIIKEYDTDSGVVTKETKTERTVRQGIESVVTEEEVKGVSETIRDSLYHFVDSSKKVDEIKEVEVEGIPDWASKWIGIAIGCGLGFLLLSLISKFRVN